MSQEEIREESMENLQSTEMPEERAEGKKPAGRRRGWGRALLGLLGRTLFLVLTIYVLFFHIIGLTLMPNGDMYPRVDAGDLLLYYRLEKTFKTQDIIVFEKASSALELPEEGEDEEFLEFIDEPETVEETAAAETMLPAAKKTFPETLLEGINRLDRRVKTMLGRKVPPEGGELFVCRVVAAAGDTVEISAEERLIVNGNTMIEPNIFYNTPEYVGFVEYPLTLQEGEVFVLADSRQGGADSRFFGVVKEEEILGTVITILRRNKL